MKVFYSRISTTEQSDLRQLKNIIKEEREKQKDWYYKLKGDYD